MHVENILWLIPFFPLVTALILRLFGRMMGRRLTGWAACASVFLSFLIAVVGWKALLALEPHARHLHCLLFPWISIGNFYVPVGFTFDPLSAVMALMVGFVGFFIHVYSIGYMSHDDQYPRYFAYLNLFTAMMFILILADNLLLMFVGWEGVGLCSYLLIGFWFKEKANADAGKKAFIVNRIGDFGFLVGIMLLMYIGIQLMGSPNFDYVALKRLAHIIDARGDVHLMSLLTFATLALFVGATGKSAQIPLYVWLPDAMAGPTPVSALIHAATMVTSGVYMIGRLNFLYTLTPFTLEVVAAVGCLTALFAATIGIAQNDIKKVLAYSTVSQLGYMFLAMGVGAYTAGIFHLLTHAFFKGLLFLASGSVIHALSGEQDMRNMGGLRKFLPITYKTFLIGALAIAGIPPLAGFVSKDEILFLTADSGGWGWVLWSVGFITAGLTAFYMFRLIFMTFFGEYRGSDETKSHIHESPAVMTVPLIVLALGSIFMGFLGWPEFLGGGNIIASWLAPVFHSSHGGHHLGEVHEWLLMTASVALAVGGIAAARYLYIRRTDLPAKISTAFPRIYNLLLNKYFVDELYDATVVKGFMKLSNSLAKFDLAVVDGIVNGAGWVVRMLARIKGAFDLLVVDGAVNGVAWVTSRLGGYVQRIQTGQIQQYLALAVAVVFAAAGAWILRVVLNVW